KYGWDNFKHEILFDNLSKEEADILEIEFIKKYNSMNKEFGFNIENGGYGKGKHSIETLKKMSDGRKGIPAWNKGISMPDEQKKLLSEKLKGKPSAFKGKHHTDENKNKLSELKSGKMKSVICIETKVIYKSLKEAETQTGISRKNISNVCNGRIIKGKRYLTAGGFHWCFLDDYNESTYTIQKPKIEDKQKSVICIETGIIYKSLKDAANKTGIYIDTIRKVCNKTKHYKTAGGYHWQFFDSDNKDTKDLDSNKDR
ncbi:MAG: NUMOD3 domain-containing DNA-binding protein, partial [Clostridia bacterium]